MRLIRLPQVKDMTGLGRSSVYKLMSEGKFPKAVTLIGRASAWVENEVVEWIEDRITERDLESFSDN
ncbi:AlpA family transcriptional regulator [Pseudidiomarina gelatinasegens]|uniref:AlpA family transcriptional regulator n=1 Tax=Pseudidiomarina gelatinasegens TaxID=2487740 RepID=A0A443YYT6_9GAMM|nr:AlpA family transcriptional regulator [Pseudidiomarina gelatinasegens]RWU09266.1 AlpA family transcriptional regulator [Pseudidiomarina gelatinasegens]